MLSSEQVQFASRKLERYTGVGGGRGGISGQPDSATTTRPFLPARTPRSSSAPPRVASVSGSLAAGSGRRGRSVPPPLLPSRRLRRGPGRARERSPGGGRAATAARATREAPAGRGGVGGPAPGGGAGCRRRRLRAAFAFRGWCLWSGRWPGAGLAPQPPSPGQPGRSAPQGGRAVRWTAALFRAASSPSPRLPGLAAAAPLPARRRPGAPCRRSSAVRVFQRGERTQVAGAAGACAEKGEERTRPGSPAAAWARAPGPGRGRAGRRGAGPPFFPVSPPPRRDAPPGEVPPHPAGSRC